MISAAPKYLQIKEHLAEQIRTGVRKPGDRIEPEQVLMKKYSVSFGTVNRALGVLRNSGLIERIWGRGTFVRDRHVVTANLAVAFNAAHPPAYPYLVPLFNGISESAVEGETHFQMFPLMGSRIFGSSSTLLQELLSERRVQGVVALDPLPPDDVVQMQSMGIPLVSIRNSYPGTSCMNVLCDDKSAARLLAQHVVRRFGHSRVLLVMGDELGYSARRVRASGVLADGLLHDLHTLGVDVPAASVVRSDFTWNSVENEIRRRLTGPDRPTAVIAASDLFATKTIELASELGLRVPENLSVAGYGDVIERMPLTTIHVPFTEMARAAGRLLCKAVRGEPAESITFPVRLVEGATVGPAPV